MTNAARTLATDPVATILGTKAPPHRAAQPGDLLCADCWRPVRPAWVFRVDMVGLCLWCAANRLEDDRAPIEVEL